MEYRIGAIMRTDFPTFTATTPIRRAVAILVDPPVAAAPVLGDDSRLIGILTQKDCFRPALHASYYREWTGQAADFMTTQVQTVDIEDEVILVSKRFLDQPHRVFPVMDGVRVAGMLDRSDVLALLARAG